MPTAASFNNRAMTCKKVKLKNGLIIKFKNDFVQSRLEIRKMGQRY